jgi:hypothetical protein
VDWTLTDETRERLEKSQRAILLGKAILNEAGDPPLNDEKTIDRARELVRLAQEAHGKGIQTESVMATLRYGEELEAIYAEWEEEAWKERAAQSDKDVAIVAGALDPTNQVIQKTIVDKSLYPPTVASEPDPLPRDLSSLGDKELRKRSGEWHAVLSHCTWRLGVEESDLIVSEMMMERAMNQCIRGASKTDGQGRKRSIDDIRADASSDPTYVKWEDRYTQHRIAVKQLRSLRDIYQACVDRLSREATMRHAEFERGQG